MLILDIEKRDVKSNLTELRERDKIPAVFYGREVESTPITVSASKFKSVWKKTGSSALISLKGLKGEREAVIQDMDINPVNSQVRHIDFYIVERGKLMEATIPFEFVGESPAVKSLGGILVKVMYELKIEVFPKDLPQNIEVDISSLKELDSQIIVKDLKLSKEIKVLDDVDEVIAAITQATEEPEETEPADISEVEIEKKGKKEEAVEEGNDRPEEK